MPAGISSIERLESRTLFSAAASPLLGVAAATHPITHVATAVKTTVGPTLHLTAGAQFSGKVGFYQSGILDPPGAYSAILDWGDGTANTNASLSYGASGTQYGYIISGAHTYGKARTYTVKVTLMIGPYAPGIEFPTTIVEYIVDKAIVAARPDSAGGLTIHPILHRKFTAKIGTFEYPAPAIGLTANVNWGDGSSSTGTVTGIGGVGVDVIEFKVTGTHKYSLPGIYAITITVYRPSLTAGGSPMVITTIDGTAKVAG